MVTPIVLVLDGEQRSALAVVRSLGSRGCAVHVGSCVARSIAGGSRFALSESILPDPLAGTDAYAAAVAQLAADRQAEVIIPVTEGSTLALLERGTLPDGVRIPTSDLEHFRRASDKAAVLALAANLGIAVPRQWTIAGREPAQEIPPDQFPVVIKPSRSVVGSDSGRRKLGVSYAGSPEALRVVIDNLGVEAGPILVQSRIEGPGLGVFLLRWGGEIVASFAHRRIREKPPSGGVSVCCESVALSPELLARSVSLLEALDWSGVAMVEFKHDIRTGRDYLMEINPRFWGSLQLAIDAGVDFPWYLVEVALGRRIETVDRWRIGARSRWCWGDVDHLIARLRHSRAALDLPGNAAGVLRTALSVLTPWRPRQRSDVFRISDPVPALRETIAWIRAL